MAERRYCTVRFNLGKPEHKKAWELLQTMDRYKYKSYSSVIIAALNEYFAKVEFADTLIKKLTDTLKDSIGVTSSTMTVKTEIKSTDDIAWDFIGN